MKAVFALAAILLSLFTQAQLVMPANSTADWKQVLMLSKNVEQLTIEKCGSLPINKIGNEWYVSILGKMKNTPHWNALLEQGVLKGSVTGRIATAKIPLIHLEEIDLNEVFIYVEIAQKVSPHLDKVLHDVGADSVQFGLGLPSSFSGEDVLIGVTDWGFDYTHPMFYDTLYQQTRIVAAWDQYKQQGDQPAGFSYGVEFNTVDELMSAQSDTSNVYTYATHGSHVAGIAGGSGGLTPYRGMAPASGFVFATFLVDEASVLDAFHWMQNVAESENKRLVINMSWGLHYMGTLDGNSLLSQAIDQLSSEGVVFVSSGGNNGDVNFHMKKTFSQDTIASRIQFYPYTANEHMWGQSIGIWGEQSHSFKVKLGVYNNLNQLLVETPYYNTSTAQAYLDSILVVGNDTVFFNLATENAHPLNDRPHMRLRIKNEFSTYRIVMSATAENGTVHFWNVVELDNGVGNWGQDFIAFGSNGIGGNTEYGIAEPACAAGVIAVAAYTASYINVIGNLAGGQLAGFSSSGPLITEVQKPDIAAPGVNVASSMSSFTDATYTPTSTVVFNNLNYDFAKLSGTSMSSPCVTGIVALMLDANPYLMPSQIKEILQATARTDDNTGPISAPGDLHWGMGKVDARAAVELALNTVGLNVPAYTQKRFRVFPNPAVDYFNVSLPAGVKLISITAMDISGKRTSLSFNKNVVDTSALSAGLYIMEIVTDDGVVNERVVIGK